MDRIRAVIPERRQRGSAWRGLGSSCQNAPLGNWMKADTLQKVLLLGLLGPSAK